MNESDLHQFSGTSAYYPFSSIFPKFYLTDGTKFLAEEAGAFWLMELVASHLIGHHDTFVVAKLEKVGQGCVVTLDDGNEQVFARQEVEYTDFPLQKVRLYACSDADGQWIILLPSEY